MVLQELTGISGKLDVASESSWSGLRPCSWCWRPRKKKNKVASSFLIGCADSAIESHAAIVLLRVFHQVELREMPSVGSVTCKPLGLWGVFSRRFGRVHVNGRARAPNVSLWREVASQLNSVRLSTHALSIAPTPHALCPCQYAHCSISQSLRQFFLLKKHFVC